MIQHFEQIVLMNDSMINLLRRSLPATYCFIVIIDFFYIICLNINLIQLSQLQFCSVNDLIWLITALIIKTEFDQM